MTVYELAQKMSETAEDVTLLDVRVSVEREMARIEPSLFIPLHELPTRIQELQAWQHKSLVVFCHHGVRSMYAMNFLRQQGFSQVDHLEGGIDVWSLEIDASVPRY